MKMKEIPARADYAPARRSGPRAWLRRGSARSGPAVDRPAVGSFLSYAIFRPPVADLRSVRDFKRARLSPMILVDCMADWLNVA